MKKVLTCLVLLAVVLPLLSCGRKDPDAIAIPNGMKIASADSDNYYLFVPENWVCSRTGDSILAYASYYDRTAVSLTTLPLSAPSVQVYWENHEGEFSSLYDDFVPPDAPEELLTSEVWDVRYLYTMTYDGEAYGGIQYFSLRGDYLYVLTYTALMGSEGNSPYEKHYEELTGIADAFLFVNDGTDGHCAPRADLEAFPDAKAPAGMKLASDTAISPYRFYIPEDWCIDITAGLTCTYDPLTLASVSVEMGTPSVATMAEYWEQVQGEVELVAGSFTLLSAHTDETGAAVLYNVVECGGQRGYCYEYTLTYLGRAFHCQKVMLLRSGKVCTLTLTAPQEFYEGAEEDFAAMRKEFRFD